MGDAVNLSARLMGSAQKVGEAILCDNATTAAASTSRMRQRFKTLTPIHVKGKEHDIPIFAPLGDAQYPVISKYNYVSRTSEMEEIRSIIMTKGK